MKGKKIIQSPFGETKARLNVVNTLIITENESYVVLSSIQEGRKILISDELSSRIKEEWDNHNFVLLKWNGGTIRKDNVYLCDNIDIEVENPSKDVFMGEF